MKFVNREKRFIFLNLENHFAKIRKLRGDKERRIERRRKFIIFSKDWSIKICVWKSILDRIGAISLNSPTNNALSSNFWTTVSLFASEKRSRYPLTPIISDNRPIPVVELPNSTTNSHPLNDRFSTTETVFRDAMITKERDKNGANYSRTRDTRYRLLSVVTRTFSWMGYFTARLKTADKHACFNCVSMIA